MKCCANFALRQRGKFLRISLKHLSIAAVLYHVANFVAVLLLFMVLLFAYL